MRTRQCKSKLVFFLIFFSFFLIIPCSFVNAAVDYEPTIEADWLYIETSPFVDYSPNSWETNVKIASGGVDLHDFTNLGIFTYSDTEVVYKSKVKFGFEITMHTNIDFRKVYPYIDLNKQHTEQFFRLHLHQDWFHEKDVWYSVSWNTIDLGIMREHNYDGNIPVKVGIRDIPGNTGTITLGGQTFDTPDYIADIVQTKVSGLTYGKVADYVDIFKTGDVTEGTVEFQELGDDFSAAQSDVIAYFQNSNLGWSAGAITKGQTHQQSMVGGSQVGVQFPNRIISDSYTFPLAAQIQPEVYEYIQYNDIRAAEIAYWDWGLKEGDIDVLVAPHSYQADKRICGVHTTNYGLHWELEVDVEFYATVESTAELTQAILDNPFLKAGDMVWDVAFTGDYKVDIPFKKDTFMDFLDGLFGDLFDNIQNILLSVAIIAVAIVILYIAVKSRKKKERQVIYIQTGGRK